MKLSYALICILTQWIAFLVVLVDSRSIPFVSSSSIASTSRQSPLSSANGSIRRQILSSPFSSPLSIRGGSAAVQDEDGDEEESNSVRDDPEFAKLQSYRLQQQLLLQLRGTYLSEALARRGLPLTTLEDVATPEGAAPPQAMDWDCALATPESPKSCLYSFDAEPYTKVIAPIDTDQWISVGALNRLRRGDPSKVEGMWHSQYAILESWFSPESKFSLLQHVGIQGFFLNTLLECLPLALGITLTILIIVTMPVLEFLVNRIAVSGLVWYRWTKWSRFVHAALPLKLLLGQMAYKGVATIFNKLLSIVKDQLVELECQILEQKIPLTVGVPTITKESLEAMEVSDGDGDEDDTDMDFAVEESESEEFGEESIEDDDDLYDDEYSDED
ncbi:MAG: hypothetical protein SGBAC_003630 [Bacillariaceae sp.]